MLNKWKKWWNDIGILLKINMQTESEKKEGNSMSQATVDKSTSFLMVWLHIKTK